jgi:carboxymethylenebutenolidase
MTTDHTWPNLDGARAYLAAPAGGGPGVLVLHAWWGLTPVFTRLCDRLAEAGFVALAPDLYQGRTASTIAEAKALMEQRDEAAMQATAEAGLAALGQHPEVRAPKGLGLVGFSMGAAWATQLSAEQPAAVAAVVLFYGAGAGDFVRARAAYLGHFADPDEWEPLEWVRGMENDMRAAGREVTLHLYPGAGHWFFEDDRSDAYQPEAAALAWTRTVAFLRQRLES